MISIDIGTYEHYDVYNNQFIYEDVGVVRFEYSLRALYNWESKWKKPFLKGDSTESLTEEELIDFYMHMAIDPIEKKHISTDTMKKLSDYIKDTQTATTFSTLDDNQNTSGRSKIYTSEELYALMIMSKVPLEFEDRNLNRLLIILRIMGSYNSPSKKMSKHDILRQNASLNAQRKAQLKTRG